MKARKFVFIVVMSVSVPDPPENCHWNVKKLPKTWLFFQKNWQKLSFFFKCQVFGNFLTVKSTFSGGSGHECSLKVATFMSGDTGGTGDTRGTDSRILHIIYTYYSGYIHFTETLMARLNTRWSRRCTGKRHILNIL